MAYDNNNSGALFKNDKKTKANHPDYKGSAEVDGVQYWVSAWLKDGKKGKFLSLAYTPKEEQKQDEPEREQEDNSDLPF